MAAPSRHVGHYIQRSSRLLQNNFEQLWGHRSFGWTPALLQQAAEATKAGATETIVIPRKKTWSKEAVLEALASTVSRDFTAYPYHYQDDPFLAPRTASEVKLFSLAQEAGRAAAKFFVNDNPKFFTKDFAEPHIPCLMPETASLRLEEVSEEALKERINLRKVTAAVDMYDQLLQAGTAVSMETTHDLLDLICFYCDRDPNEDKGLQTEDMEGEEEAEEEVMRGKRGKRGDRWKSKSRSLTWKNNNNAERIFNLLPERDTRCYSALIRGMAKHGAKAKAFNMYTDMLNNRLTADVHIYNALISVAPDVNSNYNDKSAAIFELLKDMSKQKVQPNLLTFNSVLRGLRYCGSMAKSQSMLVLNEMKALGIAPSLASYNHILTAHFKDSSRHNIKILHVILAELAGTSFTCQDPEDVFFFLSAMKICLDSKDLELGYQVHSLVEVGENWRLLGNSNRQALYYGRFFNLVCLMESIDVILKWYRQLIPSVHLLSSFAVTHLLQALDTDNRLDLLPTIWKDIRTLGHDNKIKVVEELLALMARDKHSPELQESFAECALDVKSVFSVFKGKHSLEWNITCLSYITSLLLQANKTQQAWDMLQIFKSTNRVPREGLLEDFLTLCCSSGSPDRAVELVQLSAHFCLSATPRLATRTLAEFELTEKQRAILSKLESAEEPLTEGD